MQRLARSGSTELVKVSPKSSPYHLHGASSEESVLLHMKLIDQDTYRTAGDADTITLWHMKNIKSEIIRPALISAGYAALRKSRFHGRKGNLFGTARQVILQLSRYASVQYVWLKESHKAVLAETQFTLCVLFAAFFSSVITGIVVADNFRLASFWLVDFTFLHAANREHPDLGRRPRLPCRTGERPIGSELVAPCTL